MGKKEKLYQKAKNSQGNFRFKDLCTFAEQAGFKLRKQKKGSHKTYYHPDFPKLMLNFQSLKGKAVPYQVRQLLDYIEEYNLIED